MKKRNYTKKAMVAVSGYISAADKHTWLLAAAMLGISQSEFLRIAIREKSQMVFREEGYEMPVK